MAQVVEHLSRKHKAPRTTKEKKKEEVKIVVKFHGRNRAGQLWRAHNPLPFTRERWEAFSSNWPFKTHSDYLIFF
jgi:hypothetical protein